MQRKGRKAMNMKKRFRSDRVLCYFQAEWKVLLAVTLSGLIYNLGLLAGPWFEGEMAACLIDILNGDRFFSDMLALVLAYVFAIGANAIVAAPMISSYCIMSLVWSRIFLKEKLSLKHYASILLVVAGIVILGILDI